MFMSDAVWISAGEPSLPVLQDPLQSCLVYMFKRERVWPQSHAQAAMQRVRVQRCVLRPAGATVYQVFGVQVLSEPSDNSPATMMVSLL